MKLAFICIAGALVLLLLLSWCMTHIHFRIGSRHLKVLLFGFSIRRVALANIAHASKRESKGFAERWYSTLKTSHRLLTIERKSGLIKRFCITPQNRYVFLADLKSAVRRVDPKADWAALRTYDDPTAISLKDLKETSDQDESREASTNLDDTDRRSPVPGVNADAD